jgi:uncharacterized protein
MTIKTRPLLAALAVAALALTAQAFLPAAQAQKAPGDPDRIAAARELLDAAGAARQFDAVMPTLSAQMQAIFLQMKPDHAKEIREVFDLMIRRFSDRKQELLDEVAGLYAQKLSADEMRQIADFYKSPVGTKFVSAQGELTQQTMAVGARWGQKIGKEIEQEVRQELQKRGITL